MKNQILNFSIPLHKSLLQQNLVFGVGTTALLIVLSITILLSTLFSLWFILFGIIALVVLRALCKKDPHFIDIILQSLSIKDKYLA